MRKDNWHEDQDDFKIGILKMCQQPNRNFPETKKKISAKKELYKRAKWKLYDWKYIINFW